MHLRVHTQQTFQDYSTAPLINYSHLKGLENSEKERELVLDEAKPLIKLHSIYYLFSCETPISNFPSIRIWVHFKQNYKKLSVLQGMVFATEVTLLKYNLYVHSTNNMTV